MNIPIEQILTKLDQLGEEIKKIREQLPELKSEAKEWLNLSEASALLGIKPATIYSMTSKRALPFYKKGKLLRFRQTELLAYLNNSAVPTISVIKDNLRIGKGKT